MVDTVTANGEGFVVLGAVVSETLYASAVRAVAAFQAVDEESSDAAEPGEALGGAAADEIP